jgi:drug/metabolite transporter (DMT)-like permease
MSEFFKLIVSVFLIRPTTKRTDNPLNFSNIYYFIPVSLIYVVSNNIVYLALKDLTPSMFNLLTNLKIPITVFLASVFLRKTNTFNRFTASSIVLILFGNGIASLTKNSNGENTFFGIGMMVIYSICSGSATVYSEYLLKNLLFQENIFAQNVKFCLCSILINLCVSTYNGNLLQWIGIFEFRQLLAISFMASNGIATSLVIKYLGSICKIYATSLSVFLTLFISFIFGMRADLNVFFFVGCIFSVIGVFVYIKSKNVQVNYFEDYDSVNYSRQIYNSNYRYQPIRDMFP